MISMYDVLLATSNIPVDDPIAEIWGRQMQGGYKIIEYTGTLPITINSNGDALLDYRIYGNTEQTGTPTPENPIVPSGCGIQTENLFDGKLLEGVWTSADMNRRNATGAVYRSMKLTLSPGIYTLVFSENVYLVRKIVNGVYSEPNTNISDMTFTVETLSDVGFSFRMPSSSQTSWDDNVLISVNTCSTALPYEPYGYKLPMTVYKQDFVVTSDMLDQSNWVLSPSEASNPSYFMFFDISDFISSEECVAKIYENFSAGYTPGLLVVALTNNMTALVGTAYRILNNNGVILNKKFNFSSWDKIFLCIGYGNGFRSEAIKQSKIDELFGNWKILIAPTSQTREVPVYIGENQLDAGEYVSYGEQKIYKRTENLFNINELYSTVVVQGQTFTKPTSAYFFDVFSGSDGGSTPMNLQKSIPVTSGTYTLSFEESETKIAVMFSDGETQTVIVGSTSVTPRTFDVPSDGYISIRCEKPAVCSVKKLQIVKASTAPGQYIPYLQPTDPPVPLPEIPTIDGTTIIDYDGDPKPSQMYIKYKVKE